MAPPAEENHNEFLPQSTVKPGLHLGKEASRSKSQLLGRCVLVAIVILFAGWGLQVEFPTGPSSGSALSGELPTQPYSGGTLRVGTYNIHGGVGRDRKYDLIRTSSALDGCRLIGLNEVHHPLFSKQNQAELLADRVSSNWLFSPTEYCWRGEHFGSALLTRLPVDFWQRIPLEHRGSSAFRNMLLLTLPLPKGKLNVIITHADRTADRELQLRTIFALFNSLAEPALLMGDLNTQRADPLLSDHIDSGAWTDCVGEKSDYTPYNRIDWILTRGIKPVAAGLIDDGASDHPFVWADLDLSAYCEEEH